jgi:hypothetical protein
MMRLLLLLLVLLLAPCLMAADRFAIGLSSSGAPIEATSIGDGTAQRTIVVVGGLDGTRDKMQLKGAGLRMIAIPLANPDKARLVFPPTGAAYKENTESHYLWRWIGTTAPDLVVITGNDDYGLAGALEENAVAGVGRIPVLRRLSSAGDEIPLSDAHQEMERRLARTPRQLAEQLAQVYGQEFPEAVYIPGMALLGRLRLGQRAEVERIVAPFITGGKDSLAKATSSHLAGHLIFAELGNVDLVRRAADMAATEPDALYNQMSDAVFMGCPILAAAGKLTGEAKYYDASLALLRHMQKLCLRPDGIYRHSPLNDAAWGRGDAFPALGLAIALSYMPQDNPNFAPMLAAWRAHIAALEKFQNDEGMWREVIDKPGVYPEFSATAMIATAILRGIRNGWLDRAASEKRVDLAWRAILKRTAADGSVMDMCEGTGKQKTAEDYLRRTAILGRDPRGGGMALYFATEMAAAR